jgi:hypothetical protein
VGGGGSSRPGRTTSPPREAKSEDPARGGGTGDAGPGVPARRRVAVVERRDVAGVMARAVWRRRERPRRVSFLTGVVFAYGG